MIKSPEPNEKGIFGKVRRAFSASIAPPIVPARERLEQAKESATRFLTELDYVLARSQAAESRRKHNHDR